MRGRTGQQWSYLYPLTYLTYREKTTHSYKEIGSCKEIGSYYEIHSYRVEAIVS